MLGTRLLVVFAACIAVALPAAAHADCRPEERDARGDCPHRGSPRTPTRPRPRPASAATIEIRSDADPQVAGAQVSFDGVASGVAPLRVARPAGRVLVVLKKDGFEPFSQWIELRRGQVVTLLPTLRAAVGKIVVDADVPGAEVLIDGAPLPSTTPTVATVAAGLHVVEVRKPPALPWKQTVQVDARQETKIRAELAAAIRQDEEARERERREQQARDAAAQRERERQATEEQARRDTEARKQREAAQAERRRREAARQRELAAQRTAREQWERRRARQHRLRRLGFAIGVLGGGALVLAGGFVIQTSRINNSIRSGGYATREDIQADLDRGHAYNVAAWTLGSTGVAALGAAISIVLRHPKLGSFQVSPVVSDEVKGLMVGGAIP